MLVRAIFNNQDSGSREWVFCRGYGAYKQNQSALEQAIKSNLLEFKNDCFFALQNGIDWRTRLGSLNQKDLLDEDIVTTIQNRTGVLAVQNFKSSVIERAYSCSCEVYTIYSQDAYLFELSNIL